MTYAASSDPLTYCEAMSRPDAKQEKIAMQEEIKSQIENSTWVLIQRSKNCKVVKCKWVYVIKPDRHYKVCLIAK
jgi:hypothetical protein